MYFDLLSSGAFEFESAEILFCDDDYNERRKKRRFEKGDEGGDGGLDEGKPREESWEETMTLKMTNDNEYDDKMTLTTAITK